jgi:glucose-6-phosphate isomerase
MSLKKINPTQTKSWKKLLKHFESIKNKKIEDLLGSRKSPENFNLVWDDFIIDISKNIIDNTTLELLLELADECNLGDAILKQFRGDSINETENRAVLHTAVRTFKKDSININGKDIIPSIFETREKIKRFTNNILNGNLKGATGKSFTDVVNIGIGGSDLGPVMVV